MTRRKDQFDPREGTELNTLLQGCGREAAEGQIEAAIKRANSPAQAENQIKVLNHMAISILAHHVYNEHRRRGINIEATLRHVANALREESMYIITSPDETKELVRTEPMENFPDGVVQ